MHAEPNHKPGFDPPPAAARVLRLVDRFRYPLFAVVAALHGAAFTGTWRPGGDSAAFLVLGRRLHEHGDLVTMTGYQQGVMPGYPWLLAKALSAGVDPVAAALWLNLVAVAAWLGFTFLAVRAVLGRPTAVLVTLLCGVSARAMESGVDVLPGMLFAALLAAALWVQTWRHAGARVVTLIVLLGLMVALRSVGVLVLAASGVSGIVALARSRAIGPAHPVSASRGRLWWGVGFAVVGVAAVLALPGVQRDAGILLATLAQGGVRGVAGAVIDAVVWSVPEAVIGIDPTAYVGPWLGVLILAAALLLFRVRVYWGTLVVCFVLPWLLFLSVPRYVVPLLPLLYLAMWLMVVEIERRWPARRTGQGVVFAVLLLVAANGVGIGKLVVEQRRQPFLTHYRDGKYVAADATAAWLAGHSPPGSRVLCTADERAALAWWSGRDALQLISTPAINAGVLYAVEPLDDTAHAAMRELGWSRGPAVFTAEDPRHDAVWTLHQVHRDGVPRTSGRAAFPSHTD